MQTKTILNLLLVISMTLAAGAYATAMEPGAASAWTPDKGAGNGGVAAKSGSATVEAAGAGAVKFSPSGDSYLTGGKLGIGTTSPNEFLEVAGDGRAFFGDGGGSNRKGLLIDGIQGSTAARLEAYDYGAGKGLDLVLNALAGGNVGIGTASPDGKLHVHGSGNVIGIIESTYGFAELFLAGGGSSNWIGSDKDLRFWVGGPDKVVIRADGGVIISTESTSGYLDVNGKIYQRGGLLHGDYVFEPDYELESIDEHAEFMWKNKHLKAIPKAKVDEDGQEIVEVGAHRKGIVEELEKAHIYIEQLHKQNKSLKERNKKLEARLAKIEELLNIGD